MSLGTFKGITSEQPSIRFDNDTNTGLGSTSADQIALYAGGTVVQSWASPATAGSVTQFNVLKEGITDNTATSVVTLSIPNGSIVTRVDFDVLSTLGAGGDENESVRTAKAFVVIVRTAGVATVAAIGLHELFSGSADLTTLQATVSGGQTHTLAVALGSVTGGNSATQTIDIRVTVTKGGGASDNHKAAIIGQVWNMKATGVTAAAA